MMGVQNKYLGIADNNVQPIEKVGIGNVGAVLVGVALQRRDVTAITITVDYATIGKR